jgi:hypothetical protein
MVRRISANAYYRREANVVGFLKVVRRPSAPTASLGNLIREERSRPWCAEATVGRQLTRRWVTLGGRSMAVWK